LLHYDTILDDAHVGPGGTQVIAGRISERGIRGALQPRTFPEKTESGDSHSSADMIQASCWEEASMDGEAVLGGFA